MSGLVLSLFPGIGLLDMAFEEEGFCVVRGPDVLWGGDIRRFSPPAGRFDGVIGGPPCQAFSALSHLVRACGREPRFGNLIPEFERCIVEAGPSWFLMENVPRAPTPAVPGYGAKDFLLNNAWLLGPDGFGQEQERMRRFTFGVRGAEAPNITRWIDLAALLLPEGDRCGTACQWSPDNSAEAKGRRPAVSSVSAGHGRSRQKAVVSRPGPEVVGKGGKVKRQEVAAERRRQKPVIGNGRPVPVALGGSGKPKPAVRSGDGSGSDGGPSVRMARYSFADACRLQGLPEDFLADSPFRADGKMKAVANGVPLPMGRAIARAVKEALR